MRIAILAWGSLLWDEEGNREFDKWRGDWEFDGPSLRIEFSRISKSRKDALTLVIDPENGVPTIVAWCPSKRKKLEDAVADLRCREGTTIGNIGYIRLDEQAVPRDPASATAGIFAWARRKKFDAVVWTALESNFKKRGKRSFVRAVVAYVKKLSPEGKAKAAEYVWRAPAFVQTPIRAALQQAPWFPKSGSY